MGTAPGVEPSPHLKHARFEDLQAELLSRNLRHYVPRAWAVAQPAVTFVPNWHHDAIAEHLMAVSLGQIKRLIISVAPRHTKSWITSVLWPTWHWTRWPETQWLYGSYGMILAERDAVYSRRLMDSEWYRQRWGCRCLPKTPHLPECRGFRWTTDQNVKTYYENDRGGRRFTAGVEAGTTGQGGDILVMDDPLDIAKAESEAVRQNARNYMDQVFTGRRNNPQTARIVVIAQRTHHEDVSGHLLKQGGWEHLCLPTEYEVPPQVEVTSIGFRDPRTKRGELLWGARFGQAEVAEDKRVKGPYGWAAQHQQRPSPMEGGILQRKWWRFWIPRNLPPKTRDLLLLPITSKEGIRYPPAIELPENFDEWIQSWDTSFKDEADAIRKGKDPDPVSGGVWARRMGDCFLFDRVNRRMDINDAIDALHAMTEAYPQATKKVIENKANGPAIMQLLRRKVGGLVPATPTMSKVARVATAAATPKDADARAMSMVALLAAGNVFVPHPSIGPWVWDYIEEHAHFPNGAHDDDVDMTSQALAALNPGIWRDQDMAQSELLAQQGLPTIDDTAELLRRRLARASGIERPAPGQTTVQRPFRDPYRR